MRPSSNVVRVIALAVTLVTLGGCSEYLERRDTLSTASGDAVFTNRVTHMVDPWPRESASRDIAFNGEVMQAAVQRYRTGKVIPPAGTGTGSTYQPQQSAQPAASAAPVGPTVTQSAAPVK